MEHGARGVVLLVEDLVEVRELVVAVLELGGYAVVQAENGAQALSYLRANASPLAIILDLEMPVMDGRAFRRSQLADPRLARIPVILASGSVDVPGPEWRGVPYLPKPLDADALLEALRRLR